jgi:hypothetical protein
MSARSPHLPNSELAEVRRAVDEYLRITPRETLARDLPPEALEALPPADEPKLDEAGVARMGAWLLQGPSEAPELVAAFRFNPSSDVRRSYVAALERRDGAWRVIRIGMEKAWRAR